MKRNIKFLIIFFTVLAVGLSLMGAVVFTASASHPIYPDGTLIRPQGYVEVFAIFKERKLRMPTSGIFEAYGYQWEDVQTVDQSVELKYKSVELTRVGNDSKVYWGGRLWIPTAEVFLASGFSFSDIISINATHHNYFRDVRLMEDRGEVTAYNLGEGDPSGFQGADPTVYVVLPWGEKRAISSAQIFESYGYSWTEIAQAPRELLQNYPVNSLIRQEGDFKVYKLENGNKRWITTQEAFESSGFSWSKIATVNKLEFDSYPTGSPIQ